MGSITDGEFQHTHLAEVMLQLHDDFHPGLKYEIARKREENIKTCDLGKWASASLPI